ncbi:MAG: isoprenylcysteine carboxylmethyltransferase family protein [Desulfobacteraceae bacterium]|nr:MAG: isoprenylcysteine carboxylmethyltransferase family protein [Desulfobacteraceae bacterium]
MFKTIYFIGLAISFIIRLYYRLRYRTNPIEASRNKPLGILLLFLAFIGMVVVPLTYIFTSFLNFADYPLPSWASWTGVLVFAFALWLLRRSHADLGGNWTDSLKLRKAHQLVTSGTYKYVRHPMYAAYLLWGFGQPSLLHNWIAGWSHLVSFGMLYFYRVAREEQMMLDYFGEEYQSYINRTGRIIPHLKRQKC